MASASWDPQQYRRFADERAAPFYDLLDLAVPAPCRRLVDLGCGPGELTALAAERLGAVDTLGIDNSPEMLRSAATYARDGLRFVEGDLAAWTSNGDIDIVLAAASLHWVPNHEAVLARWARALAPGGQLLVQVPADARAVTRLVANDLANREPFLSEFGEHGPPPDPVVANVLSPEDYARLLFALGFTEQKVTLRVYPHVLASTRDAVEWMKGTNLTRYARRLPPALYAEFLAEYERELINTVGDQRPFFFPFSRILFWARRPFE